jgi:D-alanyl-D-alanine carboxypeptidase/D-alanyl-D-alanine-endopeptidase (penicillin-binding protein 4)
VIHVEGSVPAGKPSLTVHRLTDAASWARGLFIEALQRNGVTVTSTAKVNDAAGLPAKDSYPANRKVAAIESAPLREPGGMVLATSYNTGANAMLCYLAVQTGSSDCEDGLPAIRALATKAGISPAELLVVDGQGGDPAAATPAAMARFHGFATGQPWGKAFKEGLPILGERGSLAFSGADSPAKGKVVGKTATKAGVEPTTGRLFISVQALSGYFDMGDGRELLFVVAASNAVFPNVAKGIFQVGDDVAMFAAALQQAAQRR